MGRKGGERGARGIQHPAAPAAGRQEDAMELQVLYLARMGEGKGETKRRRRKEGKKKYGRRRKKCIPPFQRFSSLEKL